MTVTVSQRKYDNCNLNGAHMHEKWEDSTDGRTDAVAHTRQLAYAYKSDPKEYVSRLSWSRYCLKQQSS